VGVARAAAQLDQGRGHDPGLAGQQACVAADAQAFEPRQAGRLGGHAGQPRLAIGPAHRQRVVREARVGRRLGG